MSVKKFKATLVQNGNIDAGYIEIPFDVEKEYGAKRVKVKALVNGEEYRGSVVKMGTPCHILGLPKPLRKKAGINFGDVVDVQLEKDEAERVVTLPNDLKQQLSSTALQTFQSLSYSKQKKYVLQIEEAKQESTRKNRIAKIAAKLESET